VGQNHDEAISNLLAEREVTRLNDILVWLMKLQNNTNQPFAVIAHHGPMSLETKRLNNYDRPIRALALNVPQDVKKPCPFGSGLLFLACFRRRFWFRGQDLNLRPADLAGDCAATAARISGYGPKDDELARQRRHRLCAIEVILYGGFWLRGPDCAETCKRFRLRSVRFGMYGTPFTFMLVQSFQGRMCENTGRKWSKGRPIFSQESETVAARLDQGGKPVRHSLRDRFQSMSMEPAGHEILRSPGPVGRQVICWKSRIDQAPPYRQ
jgi:hypothetical protein